MKYTDEKTITDRKLREAKHQKKKRAKRAVMVRRLRKEK